MAYKVYSSASLESGEDVLDIIGDVGSGATCGFIICDGGGSVLISYSEDGSNYGDDYELKSGEKYEFNTDKTCYSFSKIKIKFNIATSAYRCLVHY